MQKERQKKQEVAKKAADDLRKRVEKYQNDLQNFLMKKQEELKEKEIKRIKSMEEHRKKEAATNCPCFCVCQTRPRHILRMPKVLPGSCRSSDCNVQMRLHQRADARLLSAPLQGINDPLSRYAHSPRAQSRHSVFTATNQAKTA